MGGFEGNPKKQPKPLSQTMTQYLLDSQTTLKKLVAPNVSGDFLFVWVV